MKFPITHPDKILFPKDKITKADLIHYYDKVASQMLPFIRDFPVTMKRYPNGIKKEGFFQKPGSRLFSLCGSRHNLLREKGRKALKCSFAIQKTP